MRKQPENADIVAKVLLVGGGASQLHLRELLRHSHAGMRERCCRLLLLVGRHLPDTMRQLWSEPLQDTLEALVFDSMDTVRNVS